MDTQPHFIPKNISGKPLDLEHSVMEKSMEEATNTYNRACKRLLNPPIWNDLSGAFSAKFELVGNIEHQDPHRLMQENDFLKIDIPGPGPRAGDGYDWVQVTSIKDGVVEEGDESFGIQLKASANPNKSSDGIAHFFQEDATSTFTVARRATTVIVGYHGRNEKPNNQDTGLVDKVRNTLVAGGALAGISNLQWQALIEGFLNKEIGG